MAANILASYHSSDGGRFNALSEGSSELVAGSRAGRTDSKSLPIALLPQDVPRYAARFALGFAFCGDIRFASTSHHLRSRLAQPPACVASSANTMGCGSPFTH